MQHVSCRALGVLLGAARRRRVDDAVLTAGIPYDLDHLRDTKRRIEWDVWCRILRNARAVWSLEELSRLNEAFMRSPFFAYVGVIARLLFTSRDLFDWICKRQVGGGAQLFSDCVRASYQHVGDDVTIIRLEIDARYEPSPEFFWMTRGAFVAMPRLVRAGDAAVDMALDGRVAIYRVRYAKQRGLSTALRWLSFPFTAHQAARELKRTNEELQRRFLELEAAKARVDAQATQLRTAYKVNDLVHGNLDLARTLDRMLHALVDEAGFIRAESAWMRSKAGRPGPPRSGPRRRTPRSCARSRAAAIASSASSRWSRARVRIRPSARTCWRSSCPRSRRRWSTRSGSRRCRTTRGASRRGSRSGRPSSRERSSS